MGFNFSCQLKISPKSPFGTSKVKIWTKIARFWLGHPLKFQIKSLGAITLQKPSLAEREALKLSKREVKNRPEIKPMLKFTGLNET